jgi:4'-phosphopantetheinyl transferase
MQLNHDDIHIWSMSLTCSAEQERSFALLLSPDERERAKRFRFPEHRRRFIVARSVLRQILSFYTEIAPDEIAFSYGNHGKPALAASLTEPLFFNLAHSEELAVYAIARQPCGIDIEKIKTNYEPGLPERFFSAFECESLSQLTIAERVTAFYQIWAKKEAIIKASGKGVATSLAVFSVSVENITEKIQSDDETWYLQPLHLNPAFAAALASQRLAKKLLFYNFTDYRIEL